MSPPLRAYVAYGCMLPSEWTGAGATPDWGFPTFHSQGDLYVVAVSRAAAVTALRERGFTMNPKVLRVANGSIAHKALAAAGLLDEPVALFYRHPVSDTPVVRVEPGPMRAVVARWRYDRDVHGIVLDVAD
jgi:hypothetical protein